MSPLSSLRDRRLLAGVAIAAVAAAGGFGLARLTDKPAAPAGASPAAQADRKILYWYDPMVPRERYPGPGKSSMNMALIPKYADDPSEGPGVRIDPAATQNLGLRTAEVREGRLENALTATGVVEFNQRDVAIVQARSGGFVQRVYARAPGDVVRAGAPLADLLAPEWGGAQTEFLAVRRTGDPALITAARQRLRLLGMPESVIAAVERDGRARTTTTIATPIGGVIQKLDVRAGMTVSAGQTLAEVNGLSRVWVIAAIPEAQGGAVRPGQSVSLALAAYPGERFTGQVQAVLPQAEGESRTLQARIELANPGGRLRPGMFATVSLGGDGGAALLVPSEAVIRTGRRTLVMLALPNGRYQAAEVRLGREAGGQSEVLAGLRPGEKVVTSGQFLIDSEASLAGLAVRPAGGAPPAQTPAASRPAPAPGAAPSTAPGPYTTRGRIEQLTADAVTLSHQPVPALGWPAMTMTFRAPDPALTRGFKAGDQVEFAFDQPPAGPTLRRMAKTGARP